MENINQAPEPNPVPGPKKNNLAIAVILSVLVVVVLVLFVVSFFSHWGCVDGEWVRKGFPLSGKPQGGCENERATENSQKNLPGSEKELKKIGQAVSEALEPEGADEIKVFYPKSGSTISSPLKVKGRAKGYWFFEGSAPLKILDEKGNVFAESYLDAEDEWMDKEWVEFEGTVEFSARNALEGTVLFERDNPSGKPEFDRNFSIPIKFSGELSPKEISASPHIYSQCGHDPKDDPILGDCAEDCNTANWKVYKNKKYGYSFRYPADFILTNNCKNTSCVSEEGGGNTVTLSGDLSEKGWPMIEIRHLETKTYNPPDKTELMSWLKEKFPWTEECLPNSNNIYFKGKDGQMFGGYNIYFPASSQAYSRREIFYLHQGKLFEILMLDATEPQARQFYDIWLSTFSAVGE